MACADIPKRKFPRHTTGTITTTLVWPDQVDPASPAGPASSLQLVLESDPIIWDFVVRVFQKGTSVMTLRPEFLQLTPIFAPGVTRFTRWTKFILVEAA